MVKNTWMSMVAAGLLLGVTTGCATVTGGNVVRSQSPEHAKLLVHEQSVSTEGEIIQAGRGSRTSESRLQGELRGLRSHLTGTEVSHHGYRTPASACPDGNCHGGVGYGQAGGVSPHRRWGNFDNQPGPNYGGQFPSNCPPNHQEQCWDHGGRRHRGNYHYHTYSYKRPNNLVYPQCNQPGGAVTYPYYTHKGPSDFLWKGPGSQ